MQRFIQKNVLITGAASGIGQAAAKRIASEGGNLALLDINAAALNQLADRLKTEYGIKFFLHNAM